MGFVVAALLTAVPSSAQAAQLQVEARSPVVVAIDGLPAGIAHVRSDDVHRLDAGDHRVTIRNFMGSLMAEAVFDVKDGERLVVQYDRIDRTIDVVERIPLTSRPEPDPVDHDHAEEADHTEEADDAAEPHPGHVPDPSPTEAPVQSDPPASSPADPPVPERLPSATGVSSLVITGLSDISGTVRIDGESVPFTTDADGFLASELDAPLVEAHVTDNGILRFHGAVELHAGQHTACHLHYRQTTWTLDCALDGEARLAAAPSAP